MKSNCLVFALQKWRQEGGYLIIRKSKVGWWPHFLWAKSLEGAKAFHFVPEKYETDLKSPPMLFKGYVKEGDS